MLTIAVLVPAGDGLGNEAIHSRKEKWLTVDDVGVAR